jgi:hypothetical protein
MRGRMHQKKGTKYDRWISRLVELFDFPSYDYLTKHLSEKYNENLGVTELVLWRICADEAWKGLGHSSLNALAVSF